MSPACAVGEEGGGVNKTFHGHSWATFVVWEAGIKTLTPQWLHARSNATYTVSRVRNHGSGRVSEDRGSALNITALSWRLVVGALSTAQKKFHSLQ